MVPALKTAGGAVLESGRGPEAVGVEPLAAGDVAEAVGGDAPAAVPDAAIREATDATIGEVTETERGEAPTAVPDAAIGDAAEAARGEIAGADAAAGAADAGAAGAAPVPA